MSGDRAEYWQALLLGPDIFENHQRQFNVTQKLIDHAIMYLAESTGVSQTEIPAPFSGAIHMWESDPVGFGWYTIKPGFDWRELKERMSQPDDNHEVFTSTYGGPDDTEWMNAGLENADYVLNKHFGMAPF